jgi:hypothetical protein
MMLDRKFYSWGILALQLEISNAKSQITNDIKAELSEFKNLDALVSGILGF